MMSEYLSLSGWYQLNDSHLTDLQVFGRNVLKTLHVHLCFVRLLCGDLRLACITSHHVTTLYSTKHDSTVHDMTSHHMTHVYICIYIYIEMFFGYEIIDSYMYVYIYIYIYVNLRNRFEGQQNMENKHIFRNAQTIVCM